MTTISGPWAGPAGGWSVPAVTPQAQDLNVRSSVAAWSVATTSRCMWRAWLAKMKVAASAGAKTAPDVSLELVQQLQAKQWVSLTSPNFPTTPSGEDPVEVSKVLYAKWGTALP